MSNVSTQDKSVKVIFRWWEGSVIALFPEEPADYQGYYCESYQHIGQHGGADGSAIVRSSRPATEAEYAALKRELESYPYEYKLTVVQRISRQMDEQRMSTARSYRLAAIGGK